MSAGAHSDGFPSRQQRKMVAMMRPPARIEAVRLPLTLDSPPARLRYVTGTSRTAETAPGGARDHLDRPAVGHLPHAEAEQFAPPDDPEGADVGDAHAVEESQKSCRQPVAEALLRQERTRFGGAAGCASR